MVSLSTVNYLNFKYIYNLVTEDETKFADIPANVTDKDLLNMIQSMPNFGTATVSRSKDCSGFKWQVKWINGGNKPFFAVSFVLQNFNFFSNRILIFIIF